MPASNSADRPAIRSGTLNLGGSLRVHRLGFGAMQITGMGIWGPPRDRKEAIAVLRRAVELGVDLIDTADSYGPDVSETLIAEALHPYPAGLVIATKAGLERPGPNRWEMNGRPEHLRKACDGSLKRLRLDRIDLYQLHRIDSKVPAADQIGTMGLVARTIAGDAADSGDIERHAPRGERRWCAARARRQRVARARRDKGRGPLNR